jgi:hypothetical protein
VEAPDLDPVMEDTIKLHVSDILEPEPNTRFLSLYFTISCHLVSLHFYVFIRLLMNKGLHV